MVVKSYRVMLYQSHKMLVLINPHPQFSFHISKFINNFRPLILHEFSQEEKESIVKEIKYSSSFLHTPQSSGTCINVLET